MSGGFCPSVKNRSSNLKLQNTINSTSYFKWSIQQKTFNLGQVVNVIRTVSNTKPIQAAAMGGSQRMEKYMKKKLVTAKTLSKKCVAIDVAVTLPLTVSGRQQEQCGS